MSNIYFFPLIMLLVDSVYLTSTSKFYNSIVKSIQGSDIKMRILGAFLCYLILAFGLYYFILRKKESIFNAFVLGFVIYGVFETTNYAIFRKWKLSAVFLDTLWGGILFAITTYITYNTNNKK